MSVENTEENVEILCTLIVTVGTERGCFKQSYSYLETIKSNMKPRFKYMIMDLEDCRLGKRKVILSTKRN